MKIEKYTFITGASTGLGKELAGVCPVTEEPDINCTSR